MYELERSLSILNLLKKHNKSWVVEINAYSIGPNFEEAKECIIDLDIARLSRVLRHANLSFEEVEALVPLAQMHAWFHSSLRDFEAARRIYEGLSAIREVYKARVGRNADE